MKNIARMVLRDLKRLAKTPAAWAVILFLSVLPSLYTWFNVAGFWNPYDNTQNLRVCVVNEDRGVDDETLGHLDIGEQVVMQLKENDQLGWVFTDKDEAISEVSSGEAYAAFVIPSDFSADVATILTDDFQRPKLEYYVNEKKNPVAPKITDTGASTLETSINDTFFSAVTSTVTQALEKKLGDTDAALQSTKSSALAKLDKAMDDVNDARTSIGDLKITVSTAQAKAESAKAALAEANKQIDALSTALANAASKMADANTGIAKVVANLSGALADSSTQLAKACAATEAARAEVTAAIEAAKGALGDGSQVSGPDNQEVIELLQGLESYVTDEDVKAKIEETITALQNGTSAVSPWIPSNLQELKDALDAAAQAGATSEALDEAVESALAEIDAYRSSVSNDAVPTITNNLAQLQTLTINLSATVASQGLLIDQTSGVLDQLESTLSTAQAALDQTDTVLAGMGNNLSAMRADLAALDASTAFSELLGEDGLDSEKIAEFMKSPTEVETVELYELNSYGSAMAPLFINLTLWIGVFMLMVIIKLEVDDEEIENLTNNQRFIGRWLFLAPIAAVQAAICCTGCLILGVQTVNAPLFYLTAIIASLAYLAIQYTLSTSLQHVGKALCIVLVFVQIPAATGLYPIEMTPAFFRVIYPMFPFTYGVNAMRETIGGFYDGAWITYVLILAAFWAAFMLIGILVRPYLTNINRMFARQVAESGMVIGESVQLPARRYRMSQLIRAFANREEFRAQIEGRVQRFIVLYPRLREIALAVTVAVPALLTCVFAVLGVEKVIVLTTWLVWFALVVAFFLALEWVRDYLNHLVALEDMSADEARALYADRDHYTVVKPLAHRLQDDGAQPTQQAEIKASEGDGDE